MLIERSLRNFLLPFSASSLPGVESMLSFKLTRNPSSTMVLLVRFFLFFLSSVSEVRVDTGVDRGGVE